MRSIVLPSWIERLAGLDPRALAPHAFAVFRREIVYAGFDASGGGRTLLEAQSAPLPEGMFGPGPLGAPVGDPAALEAAVRLLLGRLGRAPKEAALVLPDAWARGLMIDAAELPAEPGARADVLRFRLKRLVPFRVEDLRVAASPVAFGGNGEGRAFATFANAALCDVVENAFARAGVRLGWISGTTAALLAGLAAAADRQRTEEEGDDVLGLAVVDTDGFTLALARRGEPLVWRQKTFTEGLADADRERLLTAELRLTRSFLEERLPAAGLSTVFLAAPRAVEPFWTRVLGDGLAVSPIRLRPEHLGVALDTGFDGAELLPLAGAVAREVA